MLTTEEKARRYDKAIEIAKSKIRNSNEHILYEDDVIEMFPELKVSEDEKIRKYLLKLADRCPEDSIDFMGEIKKEDVIAWLEKQCESTPADKVEHKFKVGDVIRLKGSDAEYTIKRVTDTTYYTNGWSCGIERCEEDYELVEQKPAWSEEDERMLNMICGLILSAAFANYDVDEDGRECGEYSKLKRWLKNIKDRVQQKPQWRPSKEQVEAAGRCTPLFYDPKIKKAMKSLIEDLKKLIEE